MGNTNAAVNYVQTQFMYNAVKLCYSLPECGDGFFFIFEI